MKFRLHFHRKLYNIQKVRFIVEEHVLLGRDNTINWKNILLVERLKAGSGDYAFTVYFTNDKSATYHQNSPEGAVLYHHWERYAPQVSDNAERIPIR